MIDVKNLTMIYPSGKGIFNLNFKVKKGEILGYIGPNGAGKTTTIRALLGFMKPNEGTCTINGLDCIKDAPKIQRFLGYIPGEISFFDDMTGYEFLQFMHEMRGLKDNGRQNELLKLFDLDPKGKIRRFSKGMKQKLGIVTAFMHNPDVLILDEPSSGLDPLMQIRFINLILEEKEKGKTIILSSHIFEEVEKTCDNVIIIKEGKIVNYSTVQLLKKSQRKGFIIKPDNCEQAIQTFLRSNFISNQLNNDSIEVYCSGDRIDEFIKTCAKLKLYNFDEISQSLEDVFMQYYKNEGVQQ
jgi:ABC-2 type transport system ATP-binding protein